MSYVPAQGKVTGLTFSLTSDKTSGTKAYFNLKGNINIDDAKNMIGDFQKIVMEFDKVETKPEMKHEMEEVEDGNNQFIEEVEEVENNNDQFIEDENNPEPNQSVMRYPVRGTMTLGNMTSNRNAILQAWNTFSSIKVKSSQQRSVNNQLVNYYRVVFPETKNGFPGVIMNDLNANIPLILQGHSYPVCSCPAYHYKSYEFLSQGTHIRKICKHVVEALLVANIPFESINWENRPDELPELLQNEELDEYQWM